MTGKCLRHLRIRAGLRCEDIAAAVDRNYGHLARVEREDKEIVLPLSSWFNLSQLLNIPIDKLPR